MWLLSATTRLPRIGFMRRPARVRPHLLPCALVVAMQPWQGLAQQDPGAASSPRPAAKRDGQRDFDFEIGAWKTRLSRLLNPLTGSSTWVEYEGTSVVRRVWDGRANLVELAAEGPAGRI